MEERTGGGQGVLHSHDLRCGHLLSSKSRITLVYTTRKYYKAHARQGKTVSWKHFMNGSFKVGAEKDPHLTSATPCFQGNTALGLMRVIKLPALVSRKAVWLAGIV
jgi:hypothetical protein